MPASNAGRRAGVQLDDGHRLRVGLPVLGRLRAIAVEAVEAQPCAFDQRGGRRAGSSPPMPAPCTMVAKVFAPRSRALRAAVAAALRAAAQIELGRSRPARRPARGPRELRRACRARASRRLAGEVAGRDHVADRAAQRPIHRARRAARNGHALEKVDLKNGDISNFFGDLITTEGTDQILAVTHPDTSSTGKALLEVSLQGATASSHRVKVLLNDTAVMEMRFEGMVRKAMKVTLPTVCLFWRGITS